MKYAARFRLMSTALVAGVAVTWCTAFATVTNPQVVREPYLQLATPASIYVVWRTDGPIEPVVRFGPGPTDLNQSVSGADISLRVSADVDAPEDVPRLYIESPETAAERERRGDRDPTAPPGTYQYEARIAGLNPGESYYYAIYDADRRLAGGDMHHFTTLPEPGSRADLRLWVVGDSGTGGRWQRQVYETMQQTVEADDRAIDAYIHVGDMAYGDGAEIEFQRNFFDVYAPTLRNTVCWPTMGNHEGHTSRGISGIGPYYDAYVLPTRAEAGGVPSGTEAYYSFDIANIHFVCLDSHDLDRTPDGAMAQWLRTDLDATHADWLIAFWHHPPYTKGSHDSDREGQLTEMREFIMPILETGGVDLVLTGHSHIYERSMLMDGAYTTPTTAEGVILNDGDGDPGGDGAYRKSAGLNPHEGTIQIVSGHGGAGVSRRGTMPVMREIIVEHGSVILDLQGDTLTGKMVDKYGEQRDLFGLVKRGKVARNVVENPWQPPDWQPENPPIYLTWKSDELNASPEALTVLADAGATPEVAVGASPFNPTIRHVRMRGGGASGDDGLSHVLVTDFTDDAFKMEFPFQIQGAGNDHTFGFLLLYRDPLNHYVVRVDAARNTVSLHRVINGVEALVGEGSRPLDLETAYELEVEFERGLFQIQIDDTDVLVVQDAGIAGSGRIGFEIPADALVLVGEMEIEP